MERQASIYCDICNGTKSSEIKRPEARCRPEIINYQKSNYEHLCTETLEKCFCLYYYVFDKNLKMNLAFKNINVVTKFFFMQ